MNQKQRLILAIFIPIIIFFIALMIANNLGYTETTKKLPENSFFSKYFGGTFTFNQRGNPFDWNKTWYVWFFALLFCCIFEYKVFADKKDKKGG
jgi:hypothetical protein